MKVLDWLKSHPLVIGGILAILVVLYYLFRANASSAAANASAAQSAADQAAYNAQSSGGNPLYGGGIGSVSVPVTSATPVTPTPISTPVTSATPTPISTPVAASPDQSSDMLTNLVSSGQVPASAVGGFTTNYAGIQTPIPVGENNNSDFTPHAVVSSTHAAPTVTQATTIQPTIQAPTTVRQALRIRFL